MKEKNYRLSIDKVISAGVSIPSIFIRTPQFISDTLSRHFNLNVVVKIETLNPVRSFKGRASEIFIQNAKRDEHFFCASAGNFGQAMAYSCRKAGLRLTVYASKNANPYKIQRMRDFGAEVIIYGNDFDAAKQEAKRISADFNGRFVEDSLDIESLEGAGTIGLELLEFPEKIDIILIALGNGALFNGIARIVKNKNPSTELVAIQAKGASAMIDSLRTGVIVNYESTNTIADGIAVRIPIPQALDDMIGLVDNTILVEDKSIIKGMQLIHQHLGVVAEPSGAVGIAALLENPDLFKGKTVATIICGGNLTETQMNEWIIGSS